MPQSSCRALHAAPFAPTALSVVVAATLAIMAAATPRPAMASGEGSGEAALADPTTLDRIEVHGSRRSGYAAPPSSAGTGLSLTPRQTPQSVSVLCSTRLEASGSSIINEALQSTNGIVVERVASSRTFYTARGFDITIYQFDGLGVPLPYCIEI